MPAKGGTSIMDKCPYCGAETRPGDNFCLNCGNRLQPATPSPQQAQPVMGDATLPASEEWVQPSADSSPPAQGSNWRDVNLWSVANTSLEPDANSSAAPVAQATLDKIENPAHLILRADTGEVLQDYTLEKPEISIGRAPNSDCLLSKDNLTSRRQPPIPYPNGKSLSRATLTSTRTSAHAQPINL